MFIKPFFLWRPLAGHTRKTIPDPDSLSRYSLKWQQTETDCFWSVAWKSQLNNVCSVPLKYGTLSNFILQLLQHDYFFLLLCSLVIWTTRRLLCLDRQPISNVLGYETHICFFSLNNKKIHPMFTKPWVFNQNVGLTCPNTHLCLIKFTSFRNYSFLSVSNVRRNVRVTDVWDLAQEIALPITLEC